MKHMKKKPNSQDEYGVGERGGIIVCELLPPPADSFHRPRGGPPPSEREVWESPVKAFGLDVDCI